MGLQRTESQVPFADKTGAGGDTDNRQGTDEKGCHGDRHLSADSGHFTDLLLPGGHKDGTGAKKQRNLAEGMHGDMNYAAHDAFG